MIRSNLKFKVNFEVKNANIAKTEKNKEIFWQFLAKVPVILGSNFAQNPFSVGSTTWFS